MQHRRIMCRRRERRGFRVLSEDECSGMKKPNVSRMCKMPLCKEKYEWLLSPWGPVSSNNISVKYFLRPLLCDITKYLDGTDKCFINVLKTEHLALNTWLYNIERQR